METDFTCVVGYCLQIAEDTPTAGTRTYKGLFGEVHSGSEYRSHRRSTPGRIGNEKRPYREVSAVKADWERKTLVLYWKRAGGITSEH